MNAIMYDYSNDVIEQNVKIIEENLLENIVVYVTKTNDTFVFSGQGYYKKLFKQK
jgi:hypothetical protein